jgi:hypothetical protein
VKPLAPLYIAAAALLVAAAGASAQAQPAADTALTAANASPADPIAAVSRLRRRGDVLTTEEIQASHMSNAFEVVSSLRPQWLHNRGGSHPDPDGSVEIQVFYNGQPMGNTEALKQYSVSTIATMRYIDPIRARATYGAPNGRGVITVTGR